MWWMIGLGILAVAVVAVFSFMKYSSPGKLRPLKGESGATIPGGVVQKVKMDIGGVEQGMFILGESRDNPVLLFLHGGPGSPELPMILDENNPDRLERHFTVCYWDQRGAGMSYSKGLDPGTLTLEQLVADTREVTQYLKRKFNREKIFLMGHSWGSYLGVKVAEKYPEDYAAYIGVGQLSDQRESEKLAYDYMFKKAGELGDKKCVKKLKKYDRNDPQFPVLSYINGPRSSYMNKYGIGLQHENASMAKTAWQVMTFKGYTPREKQAYVKGMKLSLARLFGQVLEDNLAESSATFEVPFYITHGQYDYQVSHTLAKAYFSRIQAPHKEFFTFASSAHSPIFEERRKFNRILGEIKERHSGARELAGSENKG